MGDKNSYVFKELIMILNNAQLNDYINNNPDAAMLRISPQIDSVNYILQLCQYAVDCEVQFVVQVTPPEFSNNLWEYIEGIRIVNEKRLVNVADILSSKGYVVYVPDIVDITNITNKFQEFDLGLAPANKARFRQCYSLLACSYSGFVKPFKKMCLFAIEGYEGIFYWLMEKHCLLAVSPTATREPVFIPTLERNSIGLPNNNSNNRSLAVLDNHTTHRIENAANAKDEASLLHEATLDILAGNSVSLQYFTYRFQFAKEYVSGYPLPEGVKLYEIVYSDKGNRGYVFNDIILETN